ncbi:heterogeneous nuclear ribonucleoprotein L isoform X2 [Anthonomus grandis grandis]|uniref:heterogeneous nuclear ribonucleoprotein L isoform X2 n=1 Tax=Anthonomus grandis grandis TaxID=2921223 RepID=UPI002166AAC3|nr:heterogeneous nuclear ribonucleoprotein L isoform X2 [Anthonomus grandis grandis]
MFPKNWREAANVARQNRSDGTYRASPARKIDGRPPTVLRASSNRQVDERFSDTTYRNRADSLFCYKMAFNGDGPHAKRQRTDAESANNRTFNTSTDEPRRKRPDETKPNHVLLFTIINPMYPITVDVLHTICQSSGQVLRIVIFKKNGVQAMVEFDNIESAIRAKDTLNGADIYSGCCTLKIDFAKPEKLNVHKNDSESWDYTVSLVKENTNGRSQPLLQEPHYGSRPQPYNPFPSDPHRFDELSGGAIAPGGFPPHDAPPFGPGAVAAAAAADVFRKGGAAPPAAAGADFRAAGEAPRANPFQQPGAVLMVYGLDPLRTNADKLFNLMCLYGNVARIKFLKSKEGTAMVQMGDSVAVERCVQNLNNVAVGLTGAAPLLNHHHKENQENTTDTQAKEHKLQLAFSKQPYLSEVTNPYPLPDKSPSYKEYLNNKNNRFMNPAMASKNRIQPPSKILHFFNTPPQVTETELIQVFKDYDVTPPKAVKLFPMKSERSSSGLLEFETTTEAVAAVMACNHAAIESPGTKFPFIMKLCFSSSRSMTIRNGDNNANGSAKMDDQKPGSN